MLVRIVITIITSLLLYGCSSPADKSVIYPLEAKEIDKVVGKDNSFLTTYSIVEEKWNYISTPQDSARWLPLTYGRLHSYLKSIKSAELNSPLFSKLREKWEVMFKENNKEVDSLVRFWKGYLTANAPDSIAVVSFQGVETEKVRNIKKEIDTLVKATIKIKSLKGKLDSVSLLYSFAPIGEQPIYYYPFNGAINSIKHKRAIRDSISAKVFPYLLPNVKRMLAADDTTLAFHYILLSVYMNGKCYNIDSLKKDVPLPVLALIEGENEPDQAIFDSNIYREQIIREMINPSFLSQSAYLKINAENYYRQIDSLAFSYMEFNGHL